MSQGNESQESIEDNPFDVIKTRSIGTLSPSSHSFVIRSQITKQISDVKEILVEKPILRIYIVRHGHSLSNQDPQVLQICSDHTVPLSKKGKEQAAECGKFLKKIIEENEISRSYGLWVSPYKRARETADLISNILGDKIETNKESILLGEQQFGLFEGLPLNELSKKYPYEFSHFEKAIEYGGRFWARMPLGESRFDVAVRLRGIIEEIHENYKTNNITDAIIVTHGVTARVLAMLLMETTPEWLEVEANPKNCSVRLIEKNKDRGYVFEGFQQKRKRPELKEVETSPKELPKKKQKIAKFDAICSTHVHSTEDKNKLDILLTSISKLEEEITNLKEEAVDIFEKSVRGD